MIDDFYNIEPYQLNKEEKSELLTKELVELTRLHQSRCTEYARFLKAVGYEEDKVKTPADIPFFPVRLFKDVDLLSIPREEVFKTMTSSGTTGQRLSKIYVDTTIFHLIHLFKSILVVDASPCYNRELIVNREISHIWYPDIWGIFIIVTRYDHHTY